MVVTAEQILKDKYLDLIVKDGVCLGQLYGKVSPQIVVKASKLKLNELLDEMRPFKNLGVYYGELLFETKETVTISDEKYKVCMFLLGRLAYLLPKVKYLKGRMNKPEVLELYIELSCINEILKVALGVNPEENELKEAHQKELGYLYFKDKEYRKEIRRKKKSKEVRDLKREYNRCGKVEELFKEEED